jgi:hypothetical protein
MGYAVSYLPWEKVGLALGGLLVAGRYELSPPKTAYEWQMPQVKGTTGARAKYLGRQPREFTVTVTLTTREEYAAWMALRFAVLQPPTDKKPFLITVDHPMLADYGIRFAIVLSEGGPTRDAQFQRWVVTLELREQEEPKVTAVAVKGAPSKGLAEGVQAKALRAIALEKKRAEVQKLSAEEQRLAYERYGKDADELASP